MALSGWNQTISASFNDRVKGIAQAINETQAFNGQGGMAPLPEGWQPGSGPG